MAGVVRKYYPQDGGAKILTGVIMYIQIIKNPEIFI
jgi:hypothetical protein